MNSSTKIHSSFNQNERGFTMMETVIMVGMAGLMLASIVMFLNNSQKLSMRSVHAQQMLSNKIGLQSWILRDLRSSSKTSLGSLLLNGGFETKVSDTQPSKWPPILTAGINYTNSASDTSVRSGFRS